MSTLRVMNAWWFAEFGSADNPEVGIVDDDACSRCYRPGAVAAFDSSGGEYGPVKLCAACLVELTAALGASASDSLK